MSTFLRSVGRVVRDGWQLAKAKIAAEPAVAIIAGVGSAITWTAREFDVALTSDGKAALTTIIVALIGLAVRGHVSPASKPQPVPPSDAMPTDDVPEV